MQELTAAKQPHSSAPLLRFGAETDSLLEETGFEPSVPRHTAKVSSWIHIDAARLTRTEKTARMTADTVETPGGLLRDPWFEFIAAGGKSGANSTPIFGTSSRAQSRTFG
jgi:hypothetical protein